MTDYIKRKIDVAASLEKMGGAGVKVAVWQWEWIAYLAQQEAKRLG